MFAFALSQTRPKPLFVHSETKLRDASVSLIFAMRSSDSVIR
jgi:hypothetical protein